MRYVAFIHSEPGAKGGTVYGISFPDFPGIVSGGDSIEDVVANGVEALAFGIEGMAGDGDEMPRPRAAEDIMADPALAEEREGAVLAWIPVVLDKGSPRRVNLSIDKGLLESIDAEAARRGMTRSAFISSAARKEITTVGG